MLTTSTSSCMLSRLLSFTLQLSLFLQFGAPSLVIPEDLCYSLRSFSQTCKENGFVTQLSAEDRFSLIHKVFLKNMNLSPEPLGAGYVNKAMKR